MTHTSDEDDDELAQDILVAMFTVVDAAMDATNTLRADPEFRDDGTLEPLFTALDHYYATLLRLGPVTAEEFRSIVPARESD
jgi:hypothetical protein